ncbi:flagellin [Methanococcoides methylutens]|uniref:Flagellin n=1 Tax=Methanococcoides methylutens TaxID=2226 RepID=A0A099T3F4_METMT|nr:MULTISPECIES: archaellin/type IV pilin N-terminal domain-containing protein [Methanococcoides]KGK98751.1 flagellin [Methanococcoides methylutens]UGV41041.1 flagellin [Methanococcoides orientis]
MKANRHLMRKDECGQVGIGTLIIFIAMVLVAAVAAAVLIQTSGVLQDRAQSTGTQAAQEVSTNMMIKSIEGVRSSNGTELSDTVDLLKVKVALNIGSSAMDLNQFVITVTDGVTTNDLVYAGNDKTHSTAMAGFSSSANASANTIQLLTNNTTGVGENGKYFFTVEKMRDDDESFSQDSPIMNQGDFVTIYISTVGNAATGNTAVGDLTVSSGSLDNTGLTIEPRSTFSLILTPEAGSSTTAKFTAPSFGLDTNIALKA